MSLLDWIFVIIPLLVVAYVGLRAQRYVQDTSDFLTAGRVAGRYVLAVSNGQAMMGLVSMIGMFEMFYNSGFAVGFWSRISAPLSILVVLTGFVVYRFRETRAMTLSQFFEIRYSRKFRIFTGVFQAVCGIIN